MLNLRERLNRDSPELHASLMRSWEIAQREWIPAIQTSKGSFNSYPHFRNIEYHLEDLLAADHPATPMVLTTLELYLLLASVLFHDFGRVYPEKSKTHPEYSAEKLPKLFPELGIPSLEIALTLARIALFHDPPKGTYAQVRRSLRSVRIEPYGSAREPFVATLLAVADHMDGSTRRAVPRYLDDEYLVGFKGAFRRLVSGSGYDRATCTIKTTMIGFERDLLLDPNSFDFANFEIAKHEKSEYEAEQPQPDMSFRCQIFDDMCGALGHRSLHAVWLPTFLREECGKRQTRTITISPKTNLPSNNPWPIEYVLATVLNDLYANRKFLENIRNELREINFPVDNWFLEFDSEVYDPVGARTNESALSEELLKEIAEEMWKVKCQMPCPGMTSYEMLADSLRMESVPLVRLAVQRISRRFNAAKETKIVASTRGWAFVSKFMKDDLINSMKSQG